VKVISLTGKNRCTETEEEVIENDELGFSDPIGSEEALITCRADTSLTQKPPGIYDQQGRTMMLCLASYQLSTSRSVRLSLPPLRNPMFPSTTSIFHLLPKVSLSLPSRRAQSFHSRLDSLSFSRTVSTKSLSSAAVQFPNSSTFHNSLLVESPA
jgi:hypothetical protein